MAKQTQVLEAAGREGRAVLHDIDVFISGINDYTAAANLGTEPWTRNDVYAVNALKDQFLGEGGGREARNSQFLGGLRQRLGARKGMSAFNDLRQFKNPELSASIDGRFPYGSIPKRPKGSVTSRLGLNARVRRYPPWVSRRTRESALEDGHCWARTSDLRLVEAALSQLS